MPPVAAQPGAASGSRSPRATRNFRGQRKPRETGVPRLGTEPGLCLLRKGVANVQTPGTLALRTRPAAGSGSGSVPPSRPRRLGTARCAPAPGPVHSPSAPPRRLPRGLPRTYCSLCRRDAGKRCNYRWPRPPAAAGPPAPLSERPPGRLRLRPRQWPAPYDDTERRAARRPPPEPRARRRPRPPRPKPTWPRRSARDARALPLPVQGSRLAPRSHPSARCFLGLGVCRWSRLSPPFLAYFHLLSPPGPFSSSLWALQPCRLPFGRPGLGAAAPHKALPFCFISLICLHLLVSHSPAAVLASGKRPSPTPGQIRLLL